MNKSFFTAVDAGDNTEYRCAKCHVLMFTKLGQPYEDGNLMRAEDVLLPNGRHPEHASAIELCRCEESMP